MNPQLPSWETLRLVGPELWLGLTMCAVLVAALLKRTAVGLQALLAGAGLIAALASALATIPQAHQFVLGQMLAIDLFSQFFKALLCLFTALVVLQWWIAARRATHVLDTPDFLCLLLGAAFGMALMASAANLLMIFLATESASLPSFALAGFRKRHRVGSEGSLKYVVFGAAASAVMLYGMSLIYGATGSLNLQPIAQFAASSAPGKGMTALLAIGLLCLLAGVAFKLSAVPMHFWCPDVFQGAPTEVTTFLSVASKGAAVCLLVRILGNFGAAAAAPGSAAAGSLFLNMTIGVAILGAVTATWGNLVAFHQNNIKRLLAYSSIAHAGYMIMTASLLPIAGGPGTLAHTIAGAILFYLLVYLFMNLGAFTVAALIVQRGGSEDLRDYAGLSRRSPVLAVALTVFLLSLFGMPGLGGFMAKIYLMRAMADAGPWAFVLIAVLLLNTLLSLYFYMRPVYYLAFAREDARRPAFAPAAAGVALLALCAAALLWTGLSPQWAVDQTSAHATLLPSPATRPPGVPAAPQAAAR